jgi:hypothetical protein
LLSNIVSDIKAKMADAKYIQHYMKKDSQIDINAVVKDLIVTIENFKKKNFLDLIL